jgi:ferredoxin
MTPITVTCWPEEATRTPNSACIWVAEAMVDGRTYTAHSRHGAPNELARQLVAAGIIDRPMVIHYRGRTGTMTWRSLRAAAMWTYSEGNHPLRRVRHKEQPEGLFLRSGDGENAFHRVPADVVVIPGPDPLKTGRRRCVSCGRDFLPARPWSRFCSPACRLRAHRRLPRQDENVTTVVERPRANSGKEALAE